MSDIFECACGAVTVGHPCLRCAGPFTMPDTHPSSDVLECPLCGKEPVRVSVGTASCDGMVDGKEVHNTIGMRPECWKARSPTIERLSAELERVKRGGEQGVAADALDFACGHCKPDEALAFLKDWRFGRAVEWPGFVKWLARQRTCAAEAKTPTAA